MDNKKQPGKGCGIAASVVLLLGCVFLVIFGLLAIFAIEETMVGVLCGGIGVMGMILFGVLLVVLIRQNKPESEDLRRWESGILTDKLIKKDLYAYRKSRITGFFVMAGVVAFFAVVIWFASDEIGLMELLLAATPVVILGAGIWEVIKAKNDCFYRIVEDVYESSEVKVTFDAVDALTNHLPTRTPTMYFEKHGEYKVDATQVHSRYPAEELLQCMEPGEGVYMIYAANEDKVLRIYRKKYWTLENK